MPIYHYDNATVSFVGMPPMHVNCRCRIEPYRMTWERVLYNRAVAEHKRSGVPVRWRQELSQCARRSTWAVHRQAQRRRWGYVWALQDKSLTVRVIDELLDYPRGKTVYLEVTLPGRIEDVRLSGTISADESALWKRF